MSSLPFTVVLLLPNYVASSFGENIVHHVRADAPYLAAHRAQEDTSSCYVGSEACDFKVIAIFDGHLQDRSAE